MSRQCSPLTSFPFVGGHAVLYTLIRCRFSPASNTGQQYVYSGSADGNIHVSFPTRLTTGRTNADWYTFLRSGRSMAKSCKCSTARKPNRSSHLAGDPRWTHPRPSARQNGKNSTTRAERITQSATCHGAQTSLHSCPLDGKEDGESMGALSSMSGKGLARMG